MRVSKNKTMCLKALIQNYYLHINLREPSKTDNLENDIKEITKYLVEFILNQNLSLMYINDTLARLEDQGLRPKSPEPLPQMSNVPGSGGSP